MGLRDHYRTLGVSPRARWEEIRHRFRTLVRALHPDINPADDSNLERLRQVVEAYEALLAHRIKAQRLKKQAACYRPGPVPDPEIVAEFFGVAPEMAAATSPPGADFRYDLRIPFTAAMLGMETIIHIPRAVTCPHCNGSGNSSEAKPQTCPACDGQGRVSLGPGMLRFGPICRSCHGRGVLLATPCSQCQGQGYRLQYKPYHLTIPPGTEDGDRLCLKGEGGPSLANGPPGNLEVVISVEPHEFFTRRGRDLYCRINISFARAALGGSVRIPTLTGHKFVKIPRGLQSGMLLRLPGAGVPAGPCRPPGDQVIEVTVTTPTHLTPEQRRLLEEFSRHGQEDLSRAAHE